jgi:hypothetical protein
LGDPRGDYGIVDAERVGTCWAVVAAVHCHGARARAQAGPSFNRPHGSCRISEPRIGSVTALKFFK